MKKKRKIGRWMILLVALSVMVYPRFSMRHTLQHVQGVEETFDLIEPYLEILRTGEFARRQLETNVHLFDPSERYEDFVTILPEVEIAVLELFLLDEDLPERPFDFRTPGGNLLPLHSRMVSGRCNGFFYQTNMHIIVPVEQKEIHR